MWDRLTPSCLALRRKPLALEKLLRAVRRVLDGSGKGPRAVGRWKANAFTLAINPMEVQQHLTIWVTEPPYNHWSWLQNPRSVIAEPGVILAMETDPARDWPVIQRELPRLRRLQPLVPVVLRLRASVLSADDVHAVQRAAVLGSRGEILDGESIESALRKLLPNPPYLELSVIEWLGLVGIPVEPVVQRLLSCGLDRCRKGRARVSEAGLGSSPGTLRRALKRAGLPKPSDILRVCRDIKAALDLQAAPESTMAAIASVHGYADQPAMCNSFRRSFQSTPSQARERLGPEWLLARGFGVECLPGIGGG